MENTTSVRLMLFFLGFSYLLLSCAAVPATRTLKSSMELPSSSAQDLLAQDATKLTEAELSGDGDAFFSDERLLTESTTDYPPTGPNPGHDPKPPGRA